jgi:hypothetical protein
MVRVSDNEWNNFFRIPGPSSRGFPLASITFELLGRIRETILLRGYCVNDYITSRSTGIRERESGKHNKKFSVFGLTVLKIVGSWLCTHFF